MTEFVEMLRRVPIFAKLDDQALSDLSSRCRRMTFKKNAVLMTEGEPGESLFMIESGSAKVFVSDEDGHELVLFVESPGSHIGEIALLDDEPRSASVVTLESTVVVSISKPDFLRSVEAHPLILISIVRELTRRLRRATDDIRSLALDNVYRRLADKLMQLAVEGDDGELVMPKPFSHQELGSMIGASREMVGKIMKELRKGGYVEVCNRRMHIVKKLPRDW